MATEAKALIERLTLLAKDTKLTDDATSEAEALRLSKQLQFALQKPKDAALELAFWPSYAFCARVAIDLGLFGLILGGSVPVSSEQLAQTSGGEELLIIRVLRGLSAVGFVNEVGENQRTATSLTKAMTTPPIVAGHKIFWDQGVVTMVKMPEYFKVNGYRCPTHPEDGPFQYAFQTREGAFQHWHKQPSVLDEFNTFMQGVRGSRPSWVEWFPIHNRILAGADGSGVLLTDVGGGRGHDVEAFRKRFPDAKGELVLQDLPAVINDIKILDDSIQRQEYDFFSPQTIQGARIYFFHMVFHNWSDEACLKILANTVSAMKKGYSKILLNEFILPDKGCPLLPIGADLNLMALHASQERTIRQWRTLLAKVGLEPHFWLAEGGGEGIIEVDLK